MKTILKISIVVLILGCVILQYDWMYGNPISKHSAEQEIEMFLLKNSKGKNYEIIHFSKSIKHGGYYLAELKEKGYDETFIITATETSVVYHNLRDIPQLKKSKGTHCSHEIIQKLIASSFISIVISSILILIKWALKKLHLNTN